MVCESFYDIKCIKSLRGLNLKDFKSSTYYCTSHPGIQYCATALAGDHVQHSTTVTTTVIECPGFDSRPGLCRKLSILQQVL